MYGGEDGGCTRREYGCERMLCDIYVMVDMAICDGWAIFCVFCGDVEFEFACLFLDKESKMDVRESLFPTILNGELASAILHSDGSGLLTSSSPQCPKAGPTHDELCLDPEPGRNGESNIK